MSNKKKERNPTSEPRQSRTFTFELYPEWSFFNNIVSHIVKEKYAMILHDKDTNDDGTIKKPHVHVVVRYGGKRLVTSVKNEYAKYGMEKRFVDTCNERAMLRYLIHLDDPDKYQYNKSEVDTNMKQVCEGAWNDEVSSDEAFMLLNDYIEQTEEYIKQTALNRYAIKNGLLKGLKAYSSQLNNARVEHNQMYSQNNSITDLIDRESVKEMAKQRSQMTQAENLVDVFGATTIQEDNGKTYTLTNAKVKTPDNTDKADIWEGLDLIKDANKRKDK